MSATLAARVHEVCNEVQILVMKIHELRDLNADMVESMGREDERSYLQPTAGDIRKMRCLARDI